MAPPKDDPPGTPEEDEPEEEGQEFTDAELGKVSSRKNEPIRGTTRPGLYGLPEKLKYATPGRLGPLHNRFIKEYLKDFNATAAARRAGVGPKSAAKWAMMAMRDERIQVRLRQAVKGRDEAIDITADRIKQEFAKLAFANLDDFMTIGDDGFPRWDFSRLDRRISAAIQELSIDSIMEKDPEGEDGELREVKRVKLKLADKMTALMNLAKFLKMYMELDPEGGTVIKIIGGLPPVPLAPPPKPAETSDP